MNNQNKAKILLSGEYEKHISFKDNKFIVSDKLFGNKSYYESKEEAIQAFLESEYVRCIMVSGTKNG